MLKILEGRDGGSNWFCSVFGELDSGTFLIKFRDGGLIRVGTCASLVRILAAEGVASLKFCYAGEVVRVDPYATDAERDVLISSIATAFMSTPIKEF